jgi:hypothetical protein
LSDPVLQLNHFGYWLLKIRDPLITLITFGEELYYRTPNYMIFSVFLLNG